MGNSIVGKRFFVLVLWTFFVLSRNSVTWAAEGPGCSDILKPDESVRNDLSISQESHTLEEFLAGSFDNMAYQHPLTIMNAFQRMATLIMSQPVSQVMEPGFSGRMVPYYKIFSEPSEVNGHKAIVGQLDAIQEFVNFVLAGARGDGSAVKMPVFTGPAGTGKTVFLDILLAMANHLSKTNSNFYFYTYEWHSLRGIDELYPVLNLQKTANGEVFEHPLPNPLHESPLVILPPEYQQAVLKMAGQRAEEISGVTPQPVLTPNPWDFKVREAVLNHYAKSDPELMSSPEKIVKVLSKHIRIKRFIPGEGGMSAKVDNQARDVDYAGLFFTENAPVKFQFGPLHPFSYFMTGKILQSNGLVLELDEFYRNDEMLRNLFLGVGESRVVQRGGSMTVMLDALIIAASNDESIAEALAKGTAKAQLDRSRMIPMRLSTHPYEISKTMLLMKGARNIEQRKLGTDEWMPANLEELFALGTQPGELMKGIEGRYALRVKMGSRPPVEISPQALEMIALTTAMSRLNTDAVAAAQLGGNQKVIADSLFTDPVTRMRALLGLQKISIAEAEELRELGMYLKEGTSGISQRDAANIWLTAAINEASLPENQNTLTPDLVKKVFKRILEQGELKPRDNQTRLNWLSLIENVEKEFTLKQLEKDVMEATGKTLNRNLPEIYDEIYTEILAIAQDSTAQQFTDPGGNVKPIDHARMQVVIHLLQTLNKRHFVPQELVDFDKAYGANSGRERIRHEELMKAIEAYYAQASMIAASLHQYGNDAQVLEVLQREYGYSKRAAEVALKLLEIVHATRAHQASQGAQRF